MLVYNFSIAFLACTISFASARALFWSFRFAQSLISRVVSRRRALDVANLLLELALEFAQFEPALFGFLFGRRRQAEQLLEIEHDGAGEASATSRAERARFERERRRVRAARARLRGIALRDALRDDDAPQSKT